VFYLRNGRNSGLIEWRMRQRFENWNDGLLVQGNFKKGSNMILIAYILFGVREFKIKLLFYLYNFTRIHDFKIIHLKDK
jgi:hypothetical protein